MTELLPIGSKKINYEGLFNAKELYATIDYWLKEMGYDKKEDEAREHVTENGRFILLVLKPNKSVTDNEKFQLSLKIQLNNIQDVTVEKDGLQMSLHKGKISMSISATIESDYRNKWITSPFWFVVNHFIDKFIYKIHFNEMQNQLQKEMNQLVVEIKSFLNMYTWR